MTDAIDLYELRELFNRNSILLCFNGPISRSLIEEIGNALKNYLEADSAQPSAAMDVFGAYVEMTQNIRQYAISHGFGEVEGAATVVVAHAGDGRYLVQAGNMVETADGEALVARVRELSVMDKAQLKAAYKAQLRVPRQPGSSRAGLGLIDIARKAALPLSADLTAGPEGLSFFSLRATI